MISTAGYLFFENHAPRGLIWLPPALTLLYGLVMLALNWLEIVDGPYPFFRVRKQSIAATVIWMVILYAAVHLISAGIWALAR